jgi:hypothetical protein
MPALMSELGKPVRCEVIITVKGERSRCDQPATVERDGHQVCAKHHRPFGSNM